MRMANALQILKFRSYKGSNQGNILFATLLISVLSTGIVLHYSFSLKNNNYKLRALQAIHDKKQALTLAHTAFEKLISVASIDNCVMYKRGKHFYFSNNTTIERELNPTTGYNVKGIFQEKSPFACCFDKQGLRKPLEEVMLGENCPGIGEKRWDLAKKRWEALKRDGALPPFIFPPLISKIELYEEVVVLFPLYGPHPALNQKILVHFLDPYARGLQEGTIKINDNSQVGRIIGELKVHFCPHSESPKALIRGSKMCQISSTETFHQFFGIENGFNYQLGSLTTDKPLFFNYAIDRTKGSIFQMTSSFQQRSQKPSKWRSLGHAGHAPVANPTIDNSQEKLFFTKTWIDKLNACFFEYKNNEPYDKIGNFKARDVSTGIIRNYIWNQVVANSEAEVFYFNGPQFHIKERLRAYGVAQYQVNEIAKEIVKSQPFTSPISFLEKLVSFPGIRDKLHHFQYLSHRTEKFKIKAWYGGYTCEMVVQREAKNETQRSWKIIYIRWNKNTKSIPTPEVRLVKFSKQIKEN